MRIVLAIVGILIAVVGVAQIIWPRRLWQFGERVAVWPADQPPPDSIYIIGAIAILLGFFLLYVGLRRLTVFSTLIWIVGAIALVSGLVAVLLPRSFLAFELAIFYARPELTKIVLTYIGGAIRILLGLAFLIAALSRRPLYPAG
ncbi:MAG: hypothetical protein HYX78_02445 [Armatimonadetes bacterium]|nr:hypothetical protein [Armatimonadota bacterium]